MLSIGVFARHARVSVRMLRHYDAIGLLHPAHIDATTGYRSYEARQLQQLNRIVALKDLGFTLQQVLGIVNEAVTGDELRGMLRLRQAELETQLADDAARLRRVEARLRIIEGEGVMPAQDVQLKTVPAVRVAQLTGVAAGFEPAAVTPVIQPLYEELIAALERAGVVPVGAPIAVYEDAGDGAVLVRATLPVDVEPSPEHDFTVVDLPRIDQAATLVHHGPMDEVMFSIQTLSRWIDAHGYRSLGYNRELYLELGDDPAQWVTELQEPVAP